MGQENPLEGLRYLSPLATVGAASLRLLAAAPVSFVWEPIVVRGTIALFAGGPGSGKTSLLFLLMVARAAGKPIDVLGFRVMPTTKGRYVVLLEGEHSAGSAARKLIRSCHVLGVPEDALDRIILVARQAVTVGSPAWKDVERLIAAGLVSDVLLDTLARVTRGDSNAERDQVDAFEIITKAIEKAPRAEDQPTVWIAAHTRKNSGVGSTDIEDVAGSIQRVGQCDSVFLIHSAKKKAGGVRSSTIHFAKLREDVGDDHPLSVTYTLASEGVEIKVPLRNRVLEVLARGPATKRSIAGELSRNHLVIGMIVDELQTDGIIEASSCLVRGQRCEVWHLIRRETAILKNGTP